MKDKVNVKVSVELRNKLMKKKYQLKLKGIDLLVERMYDLLSKLKVWDELKKDEE